MSRLYVVGTPIGNLDDITLRAIKTLKATKYIACEDTRTTKKLFSLLEIELSGHVFMAHHTHNEKNSSKGLIDILKSGVEVALVSDAGMPVVSDPGFLLIKEAIANEIKVEVIPGPSAVNTAFILSNFSDKYSFLGFFKPKTGQRQNQLKKLEPGCYVAFLSPHRIISEINDMQEVFGDNVEIFLAREMTKKFETHYRGKPNEIIEQLGESIKGEFTCVLNVIKPKNKY